MVIVTARISDAQFSIGEADRIRRAAQDVLKLSCPRCGESLRQSTVREQTRPSRTVSLVRCERCRRFVILRD
jgi:predicted RNA-binding Zn-ribbon protein involved in translation (DUF1610 family)